MLGPRFKHYVFLVFGRLHMHEHHFDKLGLAYAADEIVPCYWCCRPCLGASAHARSCLALPRCASGSILLPLQTSSYEVRHKEGPAQERAECSDWSSTSQSVCLVAAGLALSGRVNTWWHPGTACPSGDPTSVSAERTRASPYSPARQGSVKAETTETPALMRSAPSEARSSEGSQTSSGEWHWGRSQVHERNAVIRSVLSSLWLRGSVLSLSQARRPGLRKDTSGVGSVLKASPSVPPLLPCLCSC